MFIYFIVHTTSKLFWSFRTKFEMKEDQMMMQIATLEKEKTALKSQLSDLISDITEVNTY